MSRPALYELAKEIREAVVPSSSKFPGSRVSELVI